MPLSLSVSRPLWQLGTAVLAGITLLAGCSTPTTYAPTPSVTSNSSWSGRMGLQIQDPQAQEQSFSASFQLQGNPKQGRLDVFNPFGSQIAQLQWQQGSAYLQQGDQVTVSDALDTLLQQSLGTALPIPALFGWLQGQPASAPGWQVDLSRYAQGRITAQRTHPQPQAILRVVLHHAD